MPTSHNPNPNNADIFNVPSPHMILKSDNVSQSGANDLSPAETERLAFLMEEMAETSQVIGKILRHGMESRNPKTPLGPTNRELLEEELGNVMAAVHFLLAAEDIDPVEIEGFRFKKLREVEEYMHHQPAHFFLREDE